MQPLNLNIENWSMLDFADCSESVPTIADVVSLADDISNANTDDLCDLLNHQYIN